MSIPLRRDKYKKYKLLKSSQKLTRYVPTTDVLTESTMHQFLKKYGDIILKPVVGGRGYGVIRIWAASSGEYKLHHENKQKTIDDKDELNDEVKQITGDSDYMVQRRVTLATIQGRPFDLRVIVQRKSKSKSWKMTGLAVKVAGNGYIVTNIGRSKGDVLQLKTAIRQSSVDELDPSSVKDNVEKVVLRAASRLCKYLTEQYIFGFDVGLDKNGHVWIIEANCRPMLTHFQQLDDQSMYQRIQKYKQAAKSSS